MVKKEWGERNAHAPVTAKNRAPTQAHAIAIGLRVIDTSWTLDEVARRLVTGPAFGGWRIDRRSGTLSRIYLDPVPPGGFVRRSAPKAITLVLLSAALSLSVGA